MKTALQSIPNAPGKALDSDLEQAVASLFERCPGLWGFSLQEGASLTWERKCVCLEDDLFLADVTACVDPREATQLVCEIAGMLFDVLDERPEARELLCGRTFARVFH